MGAVHTEAGDPADVVKLIGVDEPRDPGPGQVLVGVTLFPIHRGDHGPFYRVDVTDLTGTETALPRAVDDLGSLCVTHTHTHTHITLTAAGGGDSLTRSIAANPVRHYAT
ncbi:MAG TPA: hypothetical protein VEF72_04530 [Mycobacterium sp.]|nr:hypothetical protein [Mycobacterium sp.]